MRDRSAALTVRTTAFDEAGPFTHDRHLHMQSDSARGAEWAFGTHAAKRAERGEGPRD